MTSAVQPRHWRMVPLVPTATQALALAQLTPSRAMSVPEVWLAQVTPPSVLVRMAYRLLPLPPPTATQKLALGQLTPGRS
jgi:hypothetical protein